MAIEQYDPDTAPDAEAWLATDEATRRLLVEVWHIKAAMIAGNATLHATMHVVIENQIAMGGEMLPVVLKLRHLMAQGLDRHEAIHALSAVMMEHMQRMMRVEEPWANANERYLNAVRRLTARKWLRSA